MEENSKVFSYIGFAIKSGKYKLGENSVSTIKKAHLIIICNSASTNAVDKAKQYAKKFRCEIIATVNKPLQEYVCKPNIKIMAITDKSLAKAIIDNKGQDFIILKDNQ